MMMSPSGWKRTQISMYHYRRAGEWDGSREVEVEVGVDYIEPTSITTYPE